MKKLLILIGAIALSNVSFSQVEVEKFGEFKLAAHERPLGLYSHVLDEGSCRFFVQMESGVDASELYFKNIKDLQSFIKSVEDASVFFETWSNVCEKNSIRFLMKKISTRPIVADVIIMQKGGLYRVKDIEVYTMFYVDNNGKCFVIVDAQPLSRAKCFIKENYYEPFDDYRLFGYDASFYEYKKPENPDSRCRIVFSSVTEIKDFTKKLESMLTLWENNPTKSNLLTR